MEVWHHKQKKKRVKYCTAVPAQRKKHLHKAHYWPNWTALSLKKPAQVDQQQQRVSLFPEEISPGGCVHKEEASQIPTHIINTPARERRQPPQRRHFLEKETPTNVGQFLPPPGGFPLLRNSATQWNAFVLWKWCIFARSWWRAGKNTNSKFRLEKGKLCLVRTRRFLLHLSYTCQFC